MGSVQNVAIKFPHKIQSILSRWMEEHFNASKGGKEPTFYSLDRTTTTRLLCSIDVEKFFVLQIWGNFANQKFYNFDRFARRRKVM